MGNIVVPEPAQKFFWSVYTHSPTFKKIVDEICKDGDYTIDFVDADFSFCDSKSRRIQLGLSTGDTHRINSDIIFELCNAFHATLLDEPQPKDFESADDYARAKERFEWASVKLHYEIINELEALDKSWAVINRFKIGFERETEKWSDFNNYLLEQIKSGHFDRIKKDFPK